MLEHLLAIIIAAVAGFIPAHVASYSAAAIPLVPRATVLFGGDMMFDRTVRMAASENGGDFLFSCIDPLLQENDLVVANLEGPITDNPSVSLGSKISSADNFTFTFAPSVAPLLYAHRVGLVNLGNNHISNFGSEGVFYTVSALELAGVRYIGDPPRQSVAELALHGVPLSFINYNEFEGSSTASTTIAQIKTAFDKGQLPIVYAHWGVEYAPSAPRYIRELAHAFVDAGAVLVVGSHPHVVEEHEIYRGADIYYSLGNFIFDQYWNDAVSHGLLVQVTLTPFGVAAVREIPVELLQDRRTCPVE